MHQCGRPFRSRGEARTGDQARLRANWPQYSLSAESASARKGEPGSAASYLLTMR